MRVRDEQGRIAAVRWMLMTASLLLFNAEALAQANSEAGLETGSAAGKPRHGVLMLGATDWRSEDADPEPARRAGVYNMSVTEKKGLLLGFSSRIDQVEDLSGFVTYNFSAIDLSGDFMLPASPTDIFVTYKIKMDTATLGIRYALGAPALKVFVDGGVNINSISERITASDDIDYMSGSKNALTVAPEFGLGLSISPFAERDNALHIRVARTSFKTPLSEMKHDLTKAALYVSIGF